MGSLGDLFGVNSRQALEFFLVALKDVSEPAIDEEELLYNASVLAHYAQVSTQCSVDFPAPSTLGSVFEQFVLDSTLSGDGDMMEIAGAQCLLLAGFFEDQMRQRHNIRWYAGLGAGFFGRAAVYTASSRRAHLLRAMAREFESWRRRHARLSRELRDQAYLLSPRTPPSPM